MMTILRQPFRYIGIGVKQLVLLSIVWAIMSGADVVTAGPPRMLGRLSSWFGASDSSEEISSLPQKEGARLCRATAEILAQHGYREAAIGLFERARQLDGKRARVARQLAVLYDQQGADTKALDEYKQALKDAPKDPDLLNDVGYYFLARGNGSEAERWFKAALAEQPQHQKAQGNLALAAAEQGRYQEAFELFARLVGPAAAHSNISMVMVRQGHYDQAKNALRNALNLDSDIPQAKTTLAYLETHFPSTASSDPRSVERSPN